MKKLTLISLALLAIVTITGCADAVNIEACLPNETLYGFWDGVWHGMISQFSFIVSLFDNSVAIYAVNNNGGWYNFGYVGGLGVMVKIIASIIKGINS